MPKSSEGLNPKQKAFCQQYLIDWNGKQSAIRAGYAPKTAEVQASHLLSLTKVKTEIKKLSDELLGTQKDELRHTVLKGLKDIAFANTTDAITVESGSVRVKDTSELSDRTKYAIEEISETTTKDGGSIKIKMHSKPKALELLGRYAGMFVDKSEVRFPDGIPVSAEIKLPDLSDLTPEEREILRKALTKKKPEPIV